MAAVSAKWAILIPRCCQVDCEVPTSVISLFATIRDCSPLLANIYYSGFSDTRNRRHFCFAFLFAKRASEDVTGRTKMECAVIFRQPITNFKF